jgi:hypothetical protein
MEESSSHPCSMMEEKHRKLTERGCQLPGSLIEFSAIKMMGNLGKRNVSTAAVYFLKVIKDMGYRPEFELVCQTKVHF